jgi:hypothetical protein
MNEHLAPKVAALEVSVRSLHSELDSVRASVDRIGGQVTAGFAEIRRDSATTGRTNWGWVIGAVSIVVALVGAIGTAWVRPLQAFDDAIEARLGRVQLIAESTSAISIRNDERMKVYQELGYFQGLGTRAAAPNTSTARP